MEVRPIGFFHTSQINKYEASKQNDHLSDPGYIELLSGQQFEQALHGLEHFSHLWILFQFHHNTEWKPMTLPPRGTSQKKGVFATRSPYRPNFIGMTAVKLHKIEGLKVFVESSDLLNGTPIIDLKPYLTFSDCIPDANLGWIDDKEYVVLFSEKAKLQIQFLRDLGLTLLEPFINRQLQYQPTDTQRKRVKRLSETDLRLSYKTWRIDFKLEGSNVKVCEVYSGYTPRQLDEHEDPYLDKDIHRKFIQNFMSFCKSD